MLRNHISSFKLIWHFSDLSWIIQDSVICIPRKQAGRKYRMSFWNFQACLEGTYFGCRYKLSGKRFDGMDRSFDGGQFGSWVQWIWWRQVCDGRFNYRDGSFVGGWYPVASPPHNSKYSDATKCCKWPVALSVMRGAYIVINYTTLLLNSECKKHASLTTWNLAVLEPSCRFFKNNDPRPDAYFHSCLLDLHL